MKMKNSIKNVENIGKLVKIIENGRPSTVNNIQVMQAPVNGMLIKQIDSQCVFDRCYMNMFRTKMFRTLRPPFT